MKRQNKFGRNRRQSGEAMPNRELRPVFKTHKKHELKEASSQVTPAPKAKKATAVKKAVEPKQEVVKAAPAPKAKVVKAPVAPVVKTQETKVSPAPKAEKTQVVKVVPQQEHGVSTTQEIRVETKKLSPSTKVKEVNMNELLKVRADERKPLVKIRNADVSFGYGRTKFKAVNNMNLNIYKGEVLGLVGESGSGKSTTGNAIANLVPLSNGSINVDGTILKAGKDKLSKTERKNLISTVQMIFQDPAASLNPYKNIFQVVSEGLDNIDIVSVFIKAFDGETINNVYDLAHAAKNQPESLKSLSFENLLADVEKGKTEKIRKELYVNVPKDLMAMEDKWALRTAEYLNSRFFEREKYFGKGKPNKKQIKKKIVIDLLQSVGLSERILNRYPLEFSGGQQQRIGISRAIALNPKLLIADEPISALDVSIQAQVINILNDLRDSLGLTILFIAHDLRMVEYISDRIAIMYKGVLVEFGEASEVVNNPVHPYSKMLLDAVPSIDGKAGSLVGYIYDPRVHDYSASKPVWNQLGEREHYVLGTNEEVTEWVKGNWPTYKAEKGGK